MVSITCWEVSGCGKPSHRLVSWFHDSFMPNPRHFLSSPSFLVAVLLCPTDHVLRQVALKLRSRNTTIWNRSFTVGVSPSSELKNNYPSRQIRCTAQVWFSVWDCTPGKCEITLPRFSSCQWRREAKHFTILNRQTQARHTQATYVCVQIFVYVFIVVDYSTSVLYYYYYWGLRLSIISCFELHWQSVKVKERS